MHLFFGARTQQDFFWINEFKALEKRSPQFHLHLCLSGNDPSWNGHRGRVQQYIPDVLGDPLSAQLYICGAPEMVREIKQLALTTWNMPKTNVHAEGYI